MKKAFLLAGALLGVLGLLAGWFFGRPAYRKHKETRFIREARAFMAKRDYRNANLAARQTLRLNSTNREACRLMADLGENFRSPQELDWRRRLAELEPTVDNKLLLTTAAMRLQARPYPIAAQTLEEMRSSAASVASFHAVSAELALRLNRPAEAAADFAEAARLEPTNVLHRLNLAVLQCRSTNELIAAEGRASLEGYSTNRPFGIVALRWLVANHVATTNLDAAEHFSSQVMRNPRCTWDDRLQHLAILKQAQRPNFSTELESAERDASTNAGAVYGLSAWLISRGLAAEDYRWLTNCPAATRSEQPVPLAIVDCLNALKDWDTLETYLQGQKWKDQEFLRLAQLSRAAEQRKQGLVANARWRLAVRAAEDRIGPLNSLLAMATAWGREQAREELLWFIGERCPREHWAFGELARFYQTKGNTHGLNKVYAALANLDSRNLHWKNNLAATSMLLRLNLSTAHELARETYAQNPEDGIIASTYAYSLHLQGRTKEGLDAFKKLKPETLDQPLVAFYYGLLLSASGQTNQAGKYLSLASKSELLPEERNLMAQASKAL